MQNNGTTSPARGKHPAKGCLLLFATAVLVCFLTVISGFACIIAIDSFNLRGEDHTLSWRVERYKVAFQFLWFDFKDAIARRFQSGTHAVSCPAGPPESEPEEEP